MGELRKFLAMTVHQLRARQILDRTQEPSGITDQRDHVIEYDRVMKTKLVVAYGAGLQVTYCALENAAGGTALDLACGPGHYTLCLARYLGLGQVTGIDLSPGMIETASRNASQQGLSDRVQFRVGDATHLEDCNSGEAELTTFTDAAHHMPDLETVGKVLREMDRITRAEGLVMLMDLVRLRTAELTERYVHTLGHDYVERGLPSFFEDFRNSMYAAWTADELHQAIPRDTARTWCHIVPRGLPTIQIVLGLPVGRKRPFVRSGLPWTPEENPVPKEMRADWRLLRLSLRFAARSYIRNG